MNRREATLPEIVAELGWGRLIGRIEEPETRGTTNVAQYSLGRVLGSGAFATVYQATRSGSQATFAVKVLADNWSHNDEIVRRFMSEATTMRAIQGPGILAVHDVGRTSSGQPFIAMDFADLGSLDGCIGSRGGRLNDVAAASILMKTTQALSQAHDRSIAHRDLKPANILLRTQPGNSSAEPADHELVVADFGLARALAEATRQTTVIAGTPEYMAPEQFEERADLRCDVFALGVLAYWLFTGRLPFPQPRADLQHMAKRRGEYIRIDQLRADFAGAPANMLHRSLSADPDSRPANAKEWLAEFASALRGDAAAPAPHAPAPRPPDIPIDETPAAGNVNYGLSARRMGMDTLRNMKRMSDRGTMSPAEFQQAKAKLLIELGFTDTAQTVGPTGLAIQRMAPELVDRYRELVAEGVLSTTEFGQVRRAVLRQAGFF